MKLEFMSFESLLIFIGSIVQPTSTDFQIFIRTEWSDGHLVYCVNIPQEYLK